MILYVIILCPPFSSFSLIRITAKPAILSTSTKTRRWPLNWKSVGSPLVCANTDFVSKSAKSDSTVFLEVDIKCIFPN